MKIIKTWLYRVLGVLMVVLGVIGVFLPVMPTVPFLIVAAFFFAHSNPEWEAKLLNHPQLGAGIRAWRERGAIPRIAKIFASLAMCGSAIMAYIFLNGLIIYLPILIALIVIPWMWSRPDA